MMTSPASPAFARAGRETGSINVLLSYRIVELFSEGLYSSPNKAIEELVANSFDAGARRVHVLLSPNLHDQGATIAVIDDGEGMDGDGLKKHWLIGVSDKRSLSRLPGNRNPIGKFGIGKLATYVLANRLTHITKCGGSFFSTSMDFELMDKRVGGAVEPKSPIRIALRALGVADARRAVKPWAESAPFLAARMKLFGRGAASAWTIAILSSLKEKVHEIRPGMLEWILRTALPLRDDFEIWLNGKKLEPSKAAKGRIRRWVLGKDITALSKPAPDTLTTSPDEDRRGDDEKRYGLSHPTLGRITGYAEVFRDLLTGKSEHIGRSHGFFVYVRDRLVNVIDGHFGISPDELRHGTFGRFRLVIHMDGLDDELRSNRESLREGPLLSTARNVLRAIFNFARPVLESHDEAESPGARLARRLGASPASVSRRPIVELARAALEGRFRSRYVLLGPARTSEDREATLAQLEARAKSPDGFVTSLRIGFDGTIDDGLALYEAATGVLRINGLHPFVGAFSDEFSARVSGQPLELFAMAEVLLEAHLFQAGLRAGEIEEVLRSRDLFLRYLAQEAGRRSALTIAGALMNARNDPNQLEIELVEAFRSLGFDATRLGGNGKPDGIATAHLSADDNGQSRRYNVSLEAKSKERTGAKISAKGVAIAAVARQRNDFQCDHAVVVAPAFPTTHGEASALAKEMNDDREKSGAAGTPKTITLITIDDLARLVRLRPIKQLGLARIRHLLVNCRLPEESHEWVNEVARQKVQRPPYRDIVYAVHRLQKEFQLATVEYGALRVRLASGAPPIKYERNDELADLCKGMAQMAPGAIMATDRAVELDQSPENVLATLESATKDYPVDDECCADSEGAV